MPAGISLPSPRGPSAPWRGEDGLADSPGIRRAGHKAEGGKDRSYSTLGITSHWDALVGTSNLAQTKLQDNIYL